MEAYFRLVSLLILQAFAVASLSSEPWKQYILAPSSRFPTPQSIKQTNGHVRVRSLDATFLAPGSQVTYDFGREVGGHISFHIRASEHNPVSLAFSESPLFIGNWSDDTGASPFSDWDQSLTISLPSEALATLFNYTTPTEKFRGGFRYLTITSLSTQPVVIKDILCLLGFHPGVNNPQHAYRGYFYTNDDILVKAWYAGAYTTQTNIAPPNTGRFLPQVRPGWAYNASLGIAGSSILLDGAKRDRAVWPGDLGIAAPSSYLAFGPRYGYEPVITALDTLFYFQDPQTGMFPFAGPDTNSFRNGAKSDTYHLWTLIAVVDYELYSGNTKWVDWHWTNITRAVEYVVRGITSDGLQNQTFPNDWAREGGGGLNVALNALTYGALQGISRLASTRSPALANAWASLAATLKISFNTLLWDDAISLYRDNTTTTSLHPQDGNALAVFFNLTISREQQKRISKALTRNWNIIGPVTPELKDTISPFVSSWEVLAHFIAGESERALELIRRLWGYLLTAPHLGGTTMVEGLSSNGSLYYRSQAGYNYDPAYTSHAHSWSTGPTQALLTHLLGLRIVNSQGKEWVLEPLLGAGGLSEARGGFETVLGMFEARWLMNEDRGFTISVKAPRGTKGRVVLPVGVTEVKSAQAAETDGSDVSLEGQDDDWITVEGVISG